MHKAEKCFCDVDNRYVIISGFVESFRQLLTGRIKSKYLSTARLLGATSADDEAIHHIQLESKVSSAQP